MLKAVFIGTRNNFDQMLVHWLSQRTDLAGVVWTESARWQKSWRGMWQTARKRAARYGVLKVVDEALFFAYYRRCLSRRDSSELARTIVQPYFERHGTPRWEGKSLATGNVNSPQVRSFLEELQPDLVLAMCVNDYFGKALRRIPRLGTFLWHEGITPEYKGLYSPFWAVHNLDFERIGYTLLRMNDDYDAGEVFAVGTARDVDPFRQHHAYLGHKAIYDSLPEVEQFLSQLEAGDARPIDRGDAQPKLYTYPGISDFIRQRYRLWRKSRTLRRA